MKTRVLITLGVLLIVALAVIVSAAASSAAPVVAGEAVVGPEAGGGLMFVENKGQFDPQVLFQAQAANGALWVTNDGLWVTITESQREPEGAGAPETALAERMAQVERQTPGVALKLSFVGANPQVVVEPFGLLETQMSYFLGNDPEQWVSGAPVWAEVRFVDLYPGIDLELSGQGGQLAPKLVVRDAAALGQVRMRVEGADAVSAMGGQMVIDTGLGPAALPLPRVEGMAPEALPVVEMPEGGLFEMAAPFVAPVAEAQGVDAGTVEPFAEDAAAAVPTTLVFSTYHGGSQGDSVSDIDVDSSGNAYVTGTTNSTNFPKKTGYDLVLNGRDAFVSKYSPSGLLLNSTFLGGADWDEGTGIFVERTSGNIYVTGSTYSSNFPVSSPSACASFGNYSSPWTDSATFITRLNSTLQTLPYSVCWVEGIEPPQYHPGCPGSGSWDLLASGQDITADAAGNAYVSEDYWAMRTWGSCDSGWPESTDYGGHCRVGKFNTSVAAGSHLWSAFVGGGGSVEGHTNDCPGIALQGTGVYVAGTAYGTSLPTTSGAYDRTFNGGGSDGFVVKLNAANGQVVYGTFVGGSGADGFNDVVVDSSGNAYAVGQTASTNFPKTSNAFQGAQGGATDVALAVLNATGGARTYATYLGGSGDDKGYGIALDGNRNAYVSGSTVSTNMDVKDPYQAAKKDGSDGFLAKLQISGSGSPLPLLYGTYWGGSAGGKDDTATGVAVDASGFVYLGGGAKSTSGFPILNAQYPTNKGGEDGFVSRLVLAAATTTMFQDGVYPTTSYAGTRDTHVRQASPTTNYGGSASLNVDGDDPNGSGKDVCTLIKWDVSTVPVGATVSAAKLTMNITNHSTGQVYEVYKVKQTWVETTATWNVQPTHDTVVLGTAGMSVLGLYNINLNTTGNSVVQGWVNAPASNYGLYLCDSANTDGFDFDSSEAATKANRPKLTLQWVNPAVIAAAPAEEVIEEPLLPEDETETLWMPFLQR